MPSNHIIVCHSLLLLPSTFPRIRVFSNESVLCIGWPKYWRFSLTISPSKEYSGLTCFRIDWLDLLAVQGTLKNLSNVTVQKHQFFSAQLSLYSNSHIHTWLREEIWFSSVQFSHSVMPNSLQPHESQHSRPPCPSPTPGACLNLSVKSVMPFNHFILCYPLLLLPSIFPSIKFFSNESVLCIGWPKYWNFSFSISPSNEYSGLISLRIDWFDLLAVQGTLKSLLQHHSSEASILLCSAFFIVQLSHPYVTTGKTIALTRQT